MQTLADGVYQGWLQSVDVFQVCSTIPLLNYSCHGQCIVTLRCCFQRSMLPCCTKIVFFGKIVPELVLSTVPPPPLVQHLHVQLDPTLDVVRPLVVRCGGEWLVNEVWSTLPHDDIVSAVKVGAMVLLSDLRSQLFDAVSCLGSMDLLVR